jgi:hypothetical protein
MKKILLGLMALSFVFMLVGSSVAANTWDTCAIDRIGVAGDSDNLFKVKSCGIASNDGKWLQLVKQKDTSMATLLTALSLGKKVKINADFAAGDTVGSSYGPVETLYLNN